MPFTLGILTVSDRAATGVYDDAGGPAVAAYFADRHDPDYQTHRRIVADERPAIESALIELATRCDLVVTTGGTGPAPRDVTPEATVAVCDRMLPGFGEAMRMHSLRTVPTAILSRATAGTRGNTLIINLPGNPKAIPVCLDAVHPAIAGCLGLIGANRP